MAKVVNTGCCIVGGGPAGLMLGFLLARAGIDVVVLEKHADFLRDFRGDTVHPSTLELMHELGLLDEFLTLPHAKARTIAAQFGSFEVPVADFNYLPTRCKFIAFMPQWDFLNFLARHAARFPRFRLRMRTQATGLLTDGAAIAGVHAQDADGAFEIHAPLVVACDGRGSALRDAAGLSVHDLGAPMDVLWFRIPRQANDAAQPLGRFLAGRIFILINRGDYWQCAFVIAKGSIDAVRARGLDAFRREIGDGAPLLRERTGAIRDWDDVKLLTVRVDRLPTWHRPGLLCIGDAAHAMSPIGGVGINLAVQDAVAAANILWQPLRTGTLDEAVLRRVQQRREFAVRVTQRIQIMLQNRVIARTLALEPARRDTPQPRAPLPIWLFGRVAFLRRVPARLIGMGVRPEHIATPDQPSA
ncbi:MAG: FAD-dependent oxidoreductase [Proteobacteria bacterium]|nr:FAD-dependent oxidoreductase [Pseudomonadota bacterium]